jgi:dihydroflavonol-4-reductase
MKAFVTGGTGLLGNNLVRALRAEGHAVAALVRSETKARKLLGDTGAELIRGDMEDVPAFADALAGSDVVFHAAAYFREYYSAGDHWQKLEAINVRGTLALAEAARARGVRRVVSTNSSGTIGFGPDGGPGSEDTPPAPIARENLYFRSKLLGSDRLREVAARTGLEVVEVLPGWMFGPWDAAPTASGRMMNARLQVTSARAERELGWRGRPLGETLRDEVAWFREQGVTADRAVSPTTVDTAA